MMNATYDPRWLAGYYDAYGDKEWTRLVSGPEEEVKLHVHSHYLRRYVRRGDAVLEIGAGAGRFTQLLAELGATVFVADISPVQIELNRQHARELGFEQAVVERLCVDMCSMGQVADGQFDAVVCYGGPLSYVFERAGEALDEIRRVLHCGGTALFSVMSLWGAVHKFLGSILELPREVNQAIVGSGDLCPATYPQGRHHCRMYRASALRDLLAAHGLEVLEMAASNCVSALWADRLAEARKDPQQWRQVLELELEACREPGCLDMGTHTIAVARKETAA